MTTDPDRDDTPLDPAAQAVLDDPVRKRRAEEGLSEVLANVRLRLMREGLHPEHRDTA